MKQLKYKMLIPDYVLGFKCIGTDCEDSCCNGWRVDIDENTYKKYKKCSNYKLKNKLERNVTRNRNNQDKYRYAKIKLNKNKECPFLNDKKLCEIQLTLGAEYLSEVCTEYPRRLNLVDGIIEKSLTLSCPEATRLALLNKNGIQFVECEEVVNENVRFTVAINTNDTKFGVGYLNYFWDIRTFTIQILKTREYTLDERLIILGLFYQKLDEIICEKDFNDINKIIEEYTDNIVSQKLKEDLESIRPQSTIQMEVLKELADERVLKGNINERYIECYSEFLFGINYDKESSIQEIGERYAQAYKHYFKRFIRENEYIFENYLVNYVFRNMTPMGMENGVFHNYWIMVLHYALIKMHLIGMCGFHKENFNIKHALKLIQSFAKNVEHNGEYIKNIFNMLKDNGYITIAYLAVLVKN